MADTGNMLIEGAGNEPSQKRVRNFSMRPYLAQAATLALTELDYSDRTIVLDRAAGVAVTLPRAIGSGARWRFFTKTTVTSNNNIIQVANADDVIQGVIHASLAGTPTTNNGWASAASSDTITMNGTTKGGILGDNIEIEDIAPGMFRVWGQLTQSGAGATPFSAAV